jgi:cytochrome c oxidase cbb3-type subunit I
MSELPSSPAVSRPSPVAAPPATAVEVDVSCRFPLLLLFLSAAAWLVIGSSLALISSIEFHSPGFLADSPWLSYGRLWPAGVGALLYGFCVPAGLGVSLWLVARLGRTPLALPWLVSLGAGVWNLGATLGIIGILAGNGTGFEYLEMPMHAAVLMFLGYLTLAIGCVHTYHQRREAQPYVSQWFACTALFWFAWIFSTAILLLLAHPARGVAQAVLTWWFAQNLLVVWLGLIGLAALFYFIPKLTGRDLHSHYLALFAYWTLILFTSWGGIPPSAPVPAWMPTLSTIAAAFTLLPVIAVVLNVLATARAKPAAPAAEVTQARVAATLPTLRFLFVGAAAFVVAGLMQVSLALPQPALHFTWFATAMVQMQTHGFFSMIIFGAVYYLLPRVVGLEFPWPRLVRAHLWFATLGILLLALPLAGAGVVQALELQNAKIAFAEVSKSSLPFLRVSTVGGLLLWLGHLFFLGNLLGLAVRFYRVKTVSAYAACTADLYRPATAQP